jgi:hypothetical protein
MRWLGRDNIVHGGVIRSFEAFGDFVVVVVVYFVARIWGEARSSA